MMVAGRTATSSRALETIGAWMLGILWLLPLALRGVDGVPSGGLRDPLRSVRAADAAQLGRRLAGRAILALSGQHRDAGHADPGGAVRAVHAGGIRLCPTDVSRARSVVRIVLLQLMVMPDVLLVENYRTLVQLHLVDTILAIALPYLGSAFGIFLLRQTFLTIPQPLDDAARLEGCGVLARLVARLCAVGEADLHRLRPGLGQLPLEQLPLAADHHQLGHHAAADGRACRYSPPPTRGSTGRSSRRQR